MHRVALLIACCVGAVVARPQAATVTPIPILVDERVPIDQFGGYGFRIQTGNGIAWQENGAASGPLNAITKSGQYAFSHPDGSPHALSYTAGVGGYQPVSDLLPTPYPLLPWQIEQVRFAESQRAAQAAAAAATAV
ncbi:cuticle protein AM1199-like [Penaeus chinensis]|uniref:cuticle protein AM1199-like n=1 Tax=Penaeus chinensis TaxID=139456 RepID=UPI001FB73F9A|nr:cuticle protein AM1199-like [Penaeus chinensis]